MTCDDSNITAVLQRRVSGVNGKSSVTAIRREEPTRSPISKQNAEAAITSMVISLELIRMIQEVASAQRSAWNLSHYSSYLQSLETVHWHAFAFNDSNDLRKNLREQRFMTDGMRKKGDNYPLHLLPHLLEQEVYALEQILKISFYLLTPSDAGAQCDRSSSSASKGKKTARENSIDPLHIRHSTITTCAAAHEFAQQWVER